jgi:[ribosomal protein S5]-alanine N-acetyltransferase
MSIVFNCIFLLKGRKIMSYIISTERLGLRKWITQDIIPFAALNADAEVMRYFPSVLTYDQTYEMVKRIRLNFESYGYGLYAVEKRDTEEFIGFTGFSIPAFESFFTPCIEIGWRFKKEEWGKGYATEAARSCLKYGFEKLNFENIVSFTAVINTRSENVMKRIGMKKTGEFNHPKIDAGAPLSRHLLYEIHN